MAAAQRRASSSSHSTRSPISITRPMPKARVGMRVKPSTARGARLRHDVDDLSAPARPPGREKERERECDQHNRSHPASTRRRHKQAPSLSLSCTHSLAPLPQHIPPHVRVSQWRRCSPSRPRVKSRERRPQSELLIHKPEDSTCGKCTNTDRDHTSMMVLLCLSDECSTSRLNFILISEASVHQNIRIGEGVNFTCS